jgi:hypothetical protein
MTSKSSARASRPDPPGFHCPQGEGAPGPRSRRERCRDGRSGRDEFVAGEIDRQGDDAIGNWTGSYLPRWPAAVRIVRMTSSPASRAFSTGPACWSARVARNDWGSGESGPEGVANPGRHHDSARGNRRFKSSRPDQSCETRSSRTFAVRLSCCRARSPVQPLANRDRRQWAPQRLLDP